MRKQVRQAFSVQWSKTPLFKQTLFIPIRNRALFWDVGFYKRGRGIYVLLIYPFLKVATYYKLVIIEQLQNVHRNQA